MAVGSLLVSVGDRRGKQKFVHIWARCFQPVINDRSKRKNKGELDNTRGYLPSHKSSYWLRVQDVALKIGNVKTFFPSALLRLHESQNVGIVDYSAALPKGKLHTGLPFSYMNVGQVRVTIPSLIPMTQGPMNLWILGFRILRVTAPNNTVVLGVLQRKCGSCLVTPPCSAEGLKARFEFLVVALLKMQVFWDVKLCRTINSGGRF